MIGEEQDEEALRWKTTDERAFNIAKEGDAKQAKDRRIDWDKVEEEDDEGRPVFKKGMLKAIEGDFLDRL